MQTSEFRKAASGNRPCDLLLANGRIVDVFSGEIVAGSVAVAAGRIVGIGEYPARRAVDLGGRFVAPGFIDAHVHIESAMTGGAEFARAVVARGTTAVVADPHEIANGLGAGGIRYMLDSAAGQPIDGHAPGLSGRELAAHVSCPPSPPAPPSMHVDLKALDFGLATAGRRLRVIDLVPDQIRTRHSIESAPIEKGRLVSDPGRDLLKIAVVERHCGSGLGMVRGFGLRQGALASSVAHDSHHIIVVGVTDADMGAAVEEVAGVGGGIAAAVGGRIAARLPLPVAGLMSLEPVQAVRAAMDRLVGAARELGSALKDPFMTLSFLALPVIPELKITDRGLVDVLRFEPVGLFV